MYDPGCTGNIKRMAGRRPKFRGCCPTDAVQGSLQLNNHFIQILKTTLLGFYYLYISDSKRFAVRKEELGLLPCWRGARFLQLKITSRQYFSISKIIFLCFCNLYSWVKGWREGKGSWGCCPADAVQGSLQAVTHPRLTPRHRSVATQPRPTSHQIGKDKVSQTIF